MIKTIDIIELETQTSQILRAVREDATVYMVMVGSIPVAILRPYTVEDDKRLRADEVAEELAGIDALAQDVAAAWTSPKGGVELVEDQRR